MPITKEYYGTSHGKTAWLFTLKNSQGMVVKITNFGANIINLIVPDQNNQLVDVVLGYGDFDHYQDNHPMFGATCGRNVNRIENAQFQIDGQIYHLGKNRGDHNIHSDKDAGFHKVFYDYRFDESSLTLTYHSPDGESGFPGNLDLTITYTLNQKNALIVDYWAVPDRKTLINITNHSYFNLNGHNQGDICDHEIMINATAFTPVNPDLIPTGQIQPVHNTPMDFLTPKPIQAVIDTDFTQLKLAGGFDHNFAVNFPQGILRLHAKVSSLKSGITMCLYSNLDGLQFYTGNNLADQNGKENTVYRKYGGLCLEPQFFPNAINTLGFKAPLFEPDRPFQATTIYQFGHVKS